MTRCYDCDKKLIKDLGHETAYGQVVCSDCHEEYYVCCLCNESWYQEDFGEEDICNLCVELEKG